VLRWNCRLSQTTEFGTRIDPRNHVKLRRYLNLVQRRNGSDFDSYLISHSDCAREI